LAYWFTTISYDVNVTESLAGRVAVLVLKGFSLKEIENEKQIPFIPTNDFIEKMRKNFKNIRKWGNEWCYV